MKTRNLRIVNVTIVCLLMVMKSNATIYSLGDSITGELNQGVLTISGKGEIRNYQALNINEAFRDDAKNIKSIVILDGVTSIGDNVFRYCSNLSSLYLPESVTSIGEYAFYECKSLSSLTLPSSIKVIGHWAFGNTGIISLTIPEGMTTLGRGAFYWCTSLKSLSLPKSLKEIGPDVFSNCRGLESLTIPEGVTAIGSMAFSNCSSLISLIIPESVTSIGEYAFSGCTGLASLYINGTLKSMGNKAFEKTCLSIITCASEEPCVNVAGSAFDTSVFDNAILCVPEGSEDIYLTSPVWCLFQKIRARDFSIKDCLLSIKTSIGGCFKINCRTKSNYSFVIESEEGWKVSSLTFNGADATASIAADGSYTTPSLTGDSELCVVFEEEGSAVGEISTEDVLRVSASGCVLSVQNEGEAVQATIFTTDGKQVKAIEAKRGTTQVRLAEGQVYLVKIGDRTFKVAM